RSLYRNFTHDRINVKRSIGVAAGEGKSADELIAVLKPGVWAGFDLAGGPDCSVVHEVRA
ncbi:DNA adenine methylase, partial [Klebsiella pneumoniae]